jgi:ribonuclease HI
MNSESQQYLLFSELSRDIPGRWRFILRATDGSRRLEVDEIEHGVQGDRLELLAVVRGLEALEEPTRVVLMTTSSYVREGIRHGLAEWRANGWRWERFGQMVPVKNLDLWQRIDRALRFHRVDCRTRRVDQPHQLSGEHSPAVLRGNGPAGVSVRDPRRLQYFLDGFAGRLRHMAAATRRGRRRLADFWATLVPSLW